MDQSNGIFGFYAIMYLYLKLYSRCESSLVLTEHPEKVEELKRHAWSKVVETNPHNIDEIAKNLILIDLECCSSRLEALSAVSNMCLVVHDLLPNVAIFECMCRATFISERMIGVPSEDIFLKNLEVENEYHQKFNNDSMSKSAQKIFTFQYSGDALRFFSKLSGIERSKRNK